MSKPMDHFQMVLGQYLDAYEMDTFRSLVPDRLLSAALEAVAAAAWDEACMAFGWALDNGEPISAAQYVASNNPHRPAVLVPAQEDNK